MGRIGALVLLFIFFVCSCNVSCNANEATHVSNRKRIEKKWRYEYSLVPFSMVDGNKGYVLFYSSINDDDYIFTYLVYAKNKIGNVYPLRIKLKRVSFVFDGRNIIKFDSSGDRDYGRNWIDKAEIHISPNTIKNILDRGINGRN